MRQYFYRLSMCYNNLDKIQKLVKQNMRVIGVGSRFGKYSTLRII